MALLEEGGNVELVVAEVELFVVRLGEYVLADRITEHHAAAVLTLRTPRP